MSRKNISSGSPWEDIVGYSRAVVTGNRIDVAGTTAANENGEVVGANAYEQSHYILSKIKDILEANGSSMNDVVRTRMFVTNIDDWQEVGKAHGEFFKDIKPASTMVEISGLVSKEMLVEIEVEAVLSA